MAHAETAPVEVTHGRMFRIAVPMMLSHITVPLLGLVDATVIGRLGDAALLGAVALGAAVFDYLFWTFGALRMGTAGLTAQAVGARDRQGVSETLARAFAVGGAIGLLLLALQVPIAWGAFAIIGASDAVDAAFAEYFAIRIWAAPVTLMNYALLGTLTGRGRTDLGFLTQVVQNLANVALTIWLVVGLEWGVAGAALGTVIGETIGFALGLAIVVRLGDNPLRARRAALFDPVALKRMLAVNGDIMIRTIALMVAFIGFQSLSARSGDVTLAANAVLLNVFLIGGYFLDGFATAAEAIGGQAYGAKRPRAFRRAAGIAVLWAHVFGALLSAGFYVGGAAFIDFVSTDPEVREAARLYLVFAALTPLAGALAFAHDGVFIGATWTAALRNTMLAALAVYIALLYLLQDLGNTALWLSFLVFLVARGLGQQLLFPRLAARGLPLEAPAPAPAPVAGDPASPRSD
ncbi:MATE family efflux transporter [Salinarimonas sp.]|uniref:MATE family efflux transporter n=1 Tax=Salinarimonas sp. TaxID=2766526 RepID=UPI0032D90666